MAWACVLKLVILSVTALGLLPVSQCVSIPFGANYGASTDALHTRVEGGGSRVDLVLDHSSAAAFQSKGKYLFGSIGMGIKLVPGNSAGTVTAFYTKSNGEAHNELDFEFLGNNSGQPYILQINLFTKGQGTGSNAYCFGLTPPLNFTCIPYFGTKTSLLRVFRNNEALGVPFSNQQGMDIHASLWDGSTWATQGGNVPVDWNSAPFVALFEGFGVDACQALNEAFVALCKMGKGFGWNIAPYQTLTSNQIVQLHHIRNNYLVYHYCTDTMRFSIRPMECATNWYDK